MDGNALEVDPEHATVPPSHRQGPFLIISRHDFRTPRKASVHFVAEELSRRGTVYFFSVGFSCLSYLTGDPRIVLGPRANLVEQVNGVNCFLWRRLVHPVNMRTTVLSKIESFVFNSAAKSPPYVFKDWVQSSRHIFIESGLGVIFFRIAKHVNSLAKFTYLASDDVSTVGCSQYIFAELQRTIEFYDSVRVPSRQLLNSFPENINACYIPHGVDKNIINITDPSPFCGGVNAVSVGSMLFDGDVIRIAAKAFPGITFHVIGAGSASRRLSGRNIRVYGEMPFRQTVPYVAHANIGLAPYSTKGADAYLADTSLKLMQYGFLGVPAVCPAVVVGDYPGRFGYASNSAGSVAKAVEAALAFGRFSGRPVFGWADVVDRLLSPGSFSDTVVAPERSPVVACVGPLG